MALKKVINDYYHQMLYDAVVKGKSKQLKKMIDSAYDINAMYFDNTFHRDYFNILCCGKTLLNMALMKKNSSIVDILIKGRANLHLALHCEVWDYYHTVNNKESSIHNIQFLINEGADINNKSEINGNRTVLFGIPGAPLDENITRILLTSGADVNICADYGVTPLHAAVKGMSTNIETIQLLLQAGAHVNVYPKHGYNALEAYLLLGSFVDNNIVMLLLAAGNCLKHAEDFLPVHLHLLPDKDIKITLKDKCRETIRDQLLKKNNLNLFLKVPKLPLPLSLKNYLLYNREWRSNVDGL